MAVQVVVVEQNLSGNWYITEKTLDFTPLPPAIAETNGGSLDELLNSLTALGSSPPLLRSGGRMGSISWRTATFSFAPPPRNPSPRPTTTHRGANRFYIGRRPCFFNYYGETTTDYLLLINTDKTIRHNPSPPHHYPSLGLYLLTNAAKYGILIIVFWEQKIFVALNMAISLSESEDLYPQKLGVLPLCLLP